MSGDIGTAAAAGIEAAAAITIATMQFTHERAKLKLQKEMWRSQKKWADMFYDLWNEKYKPAEIQFLNHVLTKKPYEPQYNAAESRAVIGVRREFMAAEQKLRRCIDPRLQGELCARRRALAVEEAKAAVAATNRGFRAEEARKDQKDAQWEQLMLQVLALGRGLVDAARGLQGQAAQGIANAANPLAGFASAIGQITNRITNDAYARENGQQGGYGLQNRSLYNQAQGGYNYNFNGAGTGSFNARTPVSI
jgi:hypothetical protein